MKETQTLTDAQLNAFIDNELHDDEKIQVIKTINTDPQAAQLIDETREDMQMLELAYHNPPLPAGFIPTTQVRTDVKKYALPVAAATLLFIFGSLSGWIASNFEEKKPTLAFSAVNEFNPQNSSSSKILIHVSSMDKERVTHALDKAEEILRFAEKNRKPVQLEVVANAEGLGILREGSAYTSRIHSLASKYRNVEFMACGIAMENSQLKEGKEIKLIPEANKIPAALNEILQKLKSGWLYIRS